MARIIWRADLDPGTLRVDAVPSDPLDPTSLQLASLATWLTVVPDQEGLEHAVISDGRNRIRLDLASGHLTGNRAVQLRFHFENLAAAQAGVEPLQRLLALIRHHRFVRTLFPHDPMIARGLMVLRVHDALGAGASQREIAAVLFGEGRVENEWDGRSDSLRSRVRRLAREARNMAAGGYRSLLGGKALPMTHDGADASAEL